MTPERAKRLQAKYARGRREYRAAIPLVRVVAGPPALVLTPAPASDPVHGPCERCAGEGQVTLKASDMTLRITCPVCGGKG